MPSLCGGARWIHASGDMMMVISVGTGSSGDGACFYEMVREATMSFETIAMSINIFPALFIFEISLL